MIQKQIHQGQESCVWSLKVFQKQFFRFLIQNFRDYKNNAKIFKILYNTWRQLFQAFWQNFVFFEGFFTILNATWTYLNDRFKVIFSAVKFWKFNRCMGIYVYASFNLLAWKAGLTFKIFTSFIYYERIYHDKCLNGTNKVLHVILYIIYYRYVIYIKT